MKYLPVLIFFSLICSAETEAPANKRATPQVEMEEELFTVKLVKLKKSKKKKKLPVASVPLEINQKY